MITDIFKSKWTAWLAFVLVLAILVLTVIAHPKWWELIDIFFAFMAAFVNLVSVTLRKINPIVSSRLNTCTFIFLLLFIISFIAEWCFLNL